jgi:hypothetical protein
MSRPASLLLSLLLAALAAVPALAQATPQMRVAEPQLLPGFRVSPNQAPRIPPAQVRMQPRPAPLAGADVNRMVLKLGLRGPVQPFVSTIKYQIENFNNSVGAEFDSTTLSDAILYGASGYIQVDFTAQPGHQYLLDCGLGQDGTYKVGTMFFLTKGNTSWLDGTLSSFNRHLLVPLNTSPNGTQSVRVIIDFTEMEFYGCQVETVSQ